MNQILGICIICFAPKLFTEFSLLFSLGKTESIWVYFCEDFFVNDLQKARCCLPSSM